MAGVTRRVAFRATVLGSLSAVLTGSALPPALSSSAVVHAQNPGVAGPSAGASAPTIDYEKDVRPILSKCFGCHGPKQAQSGLRLDLRQNALRGGDYGTRNAEGAINLPLVGERVILRVAGNLEEGSATQNK